MRVETDQLTEARQDITRFPDMQLSSLMMAVEEILAAYKLDTKIPEPSSKEVNAVERIANKGIPHHSLVYLPGHDGSSPYHEGFANRLSGNAINNLYMTMLGVEPGWRIIDTRKLSSIKVYGRSQPAVLLNYEDDHIAPIIAECREKGDIANPDDVGLLNAPLESRQGLTPLEIEAVVAPRVDDLLTLPRGSSRLPSLREQMMIGELYDLVAIDAPEWQKASLKVGSRYSPIGLKCSHTGDNPPARYYDVIYALKHRHNSYIGFRLLGQLK